MIRNEELQIKIQEVNNIIIPMIQKHLEETEILYPEVKEIPIAMIIVMIVTSLCINLMNNMSFDDNEEAEKIIDAMAWHIRETIMELLPSIVKNIESWQMKH